MIDQMHICVSGADSTEFLQGQLTNDIRRVVPGNTLRAAWCNPKGRVICLFEVSRDEAGFRLLLPLELAESTVQRLTMFRFRAKVDFTLEPAEAADPLALLQSGVPHIGREQTEKYTAHMLNLDLLDAINFEKGCYTGQEIIARTHYKGATKRRALRFESSKPLAVADKVSDGNRDIGEVLNVAGVELLAVIPTAQADLPLRVNGVELKHRPLPYL
ncbi:MAG: folate-binding protein YgfZ [Woeseiaceae bacterium]|nr:folate-binding protein YgfZ [Woeseiaceae bacterium]